MYLCGALDGGSRAGHQNGHAACLFFNYLQEEPMCPIACHINLYVFCRVTKAPCCVLNLRNDRPGDIKWVPIKR